MVAVAQHFTDLNCGYVDFSFDFLASHRVDVHNSVDTHNVLGNRDERITDFAALLIFWVRKEIKGELQRREKIIDLWSQLHPVSHWFVGFESHHLLEIVGDGRHTHAFVGQFNAAAPHY